MQMSKQVKCRKTSDRTCRTSAFSAQDINSGSNYFFFFYNFVNIANKSLNLFNHKGFHGFFHLISGEVCYVGEGSIGTYTWRWFSYIRDPCQCTRLEFAGINVDKVRGMLQVSCPVPGENLSQVELKILDN